MFPSNFDSSSFVSHQYIIAARASSAVNYPIGPWGCEGGSGDMVSNGNSAEDDRGEHRALFQ